MAYSKLRVFYGDRCCGSNVLSPERPSRGTVTVPFGEILPLLEDAARSRRSWLNDFEDDEITLSDDMYEVLLAYRRYRRFAA